MKNILVIDDNRDVRAIVTATLAEAGYSVKEADNGHDGIQMIIDQKPDLIICDVKMPGLDGYRTLEAIRRCSATAAIPFILMTGSMGANDFRRGMTSGADDYLTKPFTPSELKAAVKSRLALRTSIQTDFLRRTKIVETSYQLANKILCHKNETPISEANLPVFCLD